MILFVEAFRGEILTVAILSTTQQQTPSSPHKSELSTANAIKADKATKLQMSWGFDLKDS